LIFPEISPAYYEMTLIMASCLSVNIAASLILYRYQTVMDEMEERLEGKTGNLQDTIKNLKEEKERRRRSEAELKRIEAKYRYLVDHVHEGIVSLDVEGNILEVNRKMEELFGFSAAELVTMNLTQFLPEEGVEATKNALHASVQEGESHLPNGWLLRKDGGRIPVDFFGARIEQAGKLTIQGIFRFPLGFRPQASNYVTC